MAAEHLALLLLHFSFRTVARLTELAGIAVVAGTVLATLVLIVVLAAVFEGAELVDLPCSVFAVDLIGLDDEDVDDDLL